MIRFWCDKCLQESINKAPCKCETTYHRERLSPEALNLDDGFHPPPWNINEHPEKTEGWIEYQKAMRKDPEYYLLGCDSPNSENK